MLKQLFTTLGRLYNHAISIVVALVLCVATWYSWEFYADVRLQNQFGQEGQLIPVTVKDIDLKQRSWRDIIGNMEYLTVDYRGKDYSVRFVRDSSFVNSGDRIKLLYLPEKDAFRQPGPTVRFDRSTRKSRLIGWSTVFDFNDENRLLFLCLLLSIASFFLSTGVIVTFIPVPFLQDIARLVLIVALFASTVFFAYDTWTYYHYYQHLKTKGHEVSVRVLDTERIGHRGNHSHSSTNWYDYEATIRYQQQERVIPISEDDFDTLKPGSSLTAFYDASVNDFMSVDFSPEYVRFLIPVFFGFLTFIAIRSGRSHREKRQTVSQKIN